MKASPVLARADLLRALALTGEDDERARRYAGLLRFERQPAVATFSGVVQPVGQFRAVSGRAPIPPVIVEDREPLRAPLFAITACQRLELPAEPSEPERSQPLTPAQCAPRRSDGEAAPFVPLVRQTRLWPALKRSALETRHAGIDMPRLLRELADARPLRRLPRCRQASWGGELLVVWDCAAHLLPYQEDFQAIVADLLRQRGAGGFTLWLVDGSPQRLRERWPEKRAHCDSASAARADAIPMPAPATRVLLLSDVGALAAPPAAAHSWVDFSRQLAQHGAQPVVWAPLAPRQIDAELTRWADVFCLLPAAGLRRQRGRVASEEQRCLERARLEALREQLLARMAFCVRVEPALLRALRGVTPETAAEPALEALVWAHQPVVGNSQVSRAVAVEHVATYRQAFGELAAAEQFAALEVALHVHAWRGRATEAAELSIWQAHARPEAQAGCAAHIDEAQRWVAAFGERATRTAGADAPLRQYTLDLLARNGADQRWVAANSEWLAPVWLASGARESPSGLHDEHLAQAIAACADLSEVDCQLGVSDEGLMLWGAERPAGPAQSRLGSPMRIKRLQVGDADGKSTRLLDPAAGPQCIAALASLAGPAGGLTLGAGRHRYLVRTIERPEWAQEIGRDAFGLYADLQLPVSQRTAPDSPQTVIQRLRYIEPGHFLMGSPESEAERERNEGPQHAVTLTKGFWLADSACTQALWQAVMGDNPSHFISGKGGGAQHPVETVSWDDVQRFLRGLEKLLPGAVVASLPSEAEWEYACRAGTSTPFSFGDNISPDQVNHNGNRPYAGGRKSAYRAATVPVRSLPANPWGLYEMHGNVWEWCADGRRDYAAGDETDPRGPENQDAPRVLRGGSWLDDAGWLRSACRGRWPRDVRRSYADQGFRLSLRSSGSAGATEWPARQEGADWSSERHALASEMASAFEVRRRVAEALAGGFPLADRPTRTPPRWPIPKPKRTKR
ncbi:formylglycine-generating enzyme family protein [Accumulibacter sp.]|uniref:formylglycine-generating enzyme family protein n=1 Tax=Accumulibacter sp. TaxID=2053492 RepID=UPI0028C3BD7D|nr:formylglycine-generating enzyme family protein [Accumulibacter sp.]